MTTIFSAWRSILLHSYRSLACSLWKCHSRLTLRAKQSQSPISEQNHRQASLDAATQAATTDSAEQSQLETSGRGCGFAETQDIASLQAGDATRTATGDSAKQSHFERSVKFEVRSVKLERRRAGRPTSNFKHHTSNPYHAKQSQTWEVWGIWGRSNPQGGRFRQGAGCAKQSQFQRPAGQKGTGRCVQTKPIPGRASHLAPGLSRNLIRL
jgi:hypothetical protein